MAAAACAALALGTFGSVRADEPKPFLQPLFTDNMVLQRGVADPIWGWTTPGASVLVRMNGKRAKAVAGPDGKWLAKIGPFAAGGPYTLSVTGPQAVTLSNVLVGDVWLCTGQSNMEFGVGNLPQPEQTITAASYPNIRRFTVQHNTFNTPQQTFTDVPWAACTPAEIEKCGTGGFHGFSAVGYFFGRDLQQNLHVPISLISTNWVGTPAEAWTSAAALERKVPGYTPQIRFAAIASAAPADQAPLQAGWYAKFDPSTAGNWQSGTLDDSAWDSIPLPGYFQDAEIPELGSMSGVVWFRRTFDPPAGGFGKAAVLHLKADDNDATWINGVPVGATAGSDVSRAYPVPADLLKPTGNVVAVRVLGKGGIYGAPADLALEVPGGADVPLAGHWRYHIGVPFDAQSLPDCEIATALDVGEQCNIHPGNKQEVGRRLALVAEAKVYGQPVDYAGPVYRSMTVAGSSAVLAFGHLGGGLVAKDGKPLTGFQIAGAGRFRAVRRALCVGSVPAVQPLQQSRPARVPV